MSETAICTERIAADIESIGSMTETNPTEGYSRPTFSEAWAAARGYIVREAEAVGGVMRTDAFGNLHIRRPEHSGRVWLCGSHIDSVPSGGKYDGVMGVAVALEVFRVAPEAPLELVVFAEEEGTTFGLGLLGSRSWAGELTADTLATLHNQQGRSFIDAGAAYGVVPEAMPRDRLDPQRYYGMIEVHAEQGCGLWNDGVAVAAVSRINGRREYEVCVRGQGNHAGSTSMKDRRDAACGASEAVLMIEALGKRLDDKQKHSVLTVGRMLVRPNAMNVIPREVAFSVDFRAQDNPTLEQGEAEMCSALQAIAARRGLHIDTRRKEQVSPAPLDQALRNRFQDAAARLGRELSEVPSGALHDAAKIAPYLAAGMLFVASRDGISHDPTEYSKTEDIAQAACIVLETVRRPPG